MLNFINISHEIKRDMLIASIAQCADVYMVKNEI